MLCMKLKMINISKTVRNQELHPRFKSGCIPFLCLDGCHLRSIWYSSISYYLRWEQWSLPRGFCSCWGRESELAMVPTTTLSRLWSLRWTTSPSSMINRRGCKKLLLNFFLLQNIGLAWHTFGRILRYITLETSSKGFYEIVLEHTLCMNTLSL